MSSSRIRYSIPRTCPTRKCRATCARSSCSRLAELLPPDYGDADLWRAAHKAAQEVLTARWPQRAAEVDALLVEKEGGAK